VEVFSPAGQSECVIGGSWGLQDTMLLSGDPAGQLFIGDRRADTVNLAVPVPVSTRATSWGSLKIQYR
jgi:hypothetical protein